MASPFPLLALPAELRLLIYDCLLGPRRNEAQRPDRGNVVTTISRICSRTYPRPPGMLNAPRSHNWGDRACNCHARTFYILDNKDKLCPQILRVNKQIYREALPSLYQRRTFLADPNRTRFDLEKRLSESWFLLDRFLASLPIEARDNIHHIRIALLLLRFELLGCRVAFRDISSRLPALRSIDLHVFPSPDRPSWSKDGLLILNDFVTDDRDVFLGPVMSFADARINIVAVNPYDLEAVLFDRFKTTIEITVWKQLLPMRMKRQRRKIARIHKLLMSRSDEDEDIATMDMVLNETEVVSQEQKVS